MDNSENNGRDMDEVIAQITWTVQDVHDAFVEAYGREPTEDELDEALDSFYEEGVEERGIEAGWDVIYNNLPSEERLQELADERKQNESIAAEPAPETINPEPAPVPFHAGLVVSYSPFGYDGELVTVETDLRRGIPAVDIVGLADNAIKESRERMRAAISNSGYEFPQKRVLIALSPADMKKEGAGFDLALALSVLNRQDAVKAGNPELADGGERIMVFGELELSGTVRPVRGAFAAAETAKKNGIKKIICHPVNATEFANIPGISVATAENLHEAYEALHEESHFIENAPAVSAGESVSFSNDEEILSAAGRPFEGYYDVCRSIEIAMAGKHNLSLTGAPGCGKTILVLSLVPALTPLLTEEEKRSTDRIYSLAGLSSPNNYLDYKAPFRMPHQSASIEGMIGGGSNCRPGEISLAHNGTLFLDEAAEFRTAVLSVLRVPLESKTITLSRAGRSTVYPADFQLVTAQNPCPCGNFGSSGRICLCSGHAVEMYWKKFSDPLLDRIAINEFVEKDENDSRKFNLTKARERVAKAYEIQRKRGVFNSQLSPEEIRFYCSLDEDCSKAFQHYCEKDELSIRQSLNLLKVSLTIANMDGRENIRKKDIAEAARIVSPLYKDLSLNLDRKRKPVTLRETEEKER